MHHPSLVKDSCIPARMYIHRSISSGPGGSGKTTFACAYEAIWTIRASFLPPRPLVSENIPASDLMNLPRCPTFCLEDIRSLASASTYRMYACGHA